MSETRLTPELPLTPANMIADLLAWRAQVHVEGAVDEEDAWIDHMIQQVSSGTITPEEANSCLQKKKIGRQDYH